MKTMTEYLTATDGKSPEQIKRWYAHLPSEEKLQLETELAHYLDQFYPCPATGLSGASEWPGLNYYDGRFERFVCLKSRKLTQPVAGRNN
jgi:hypothetical protein